MKYLLPLCMFILVGCASHTMNEGEFHYNQRVRIQSQNSFYKECSGYISAKAILDGKTVYFVSNLCQDLDEEYFYASELKALN